MGNQGLWFNESSRMGIRRFGPLDKWVGGRDQEPRGFNGSDQLWAPSHACDGEVVVDEAGLSSKGSEAIRAGHGRWGVPGEPCGGVPAVGKGPEVGER